MKQNKKSVLLFLATVSLVLVLFLTSLFLFAYNPWFYGWQYKQHGVYDQFGYEETWDATHNLWDFMLFRTDTLTDFFSERDRLHMFDVRDILNVLQYVLFSFFLVLLSILVYYCYDDSKHIGPFIDTLCLRVSYGIFGIVGFSFFFVLFFDTSFIWFHKIFFYNDLWMMDPLVDKLVLLYPEIFFQTIFVFIVCLPLVLAVLCLFVRSLVKRRKSRKK